MEDSERNVFECGDLNIKHYILIYLSHQSLWLFYNAYLFIFVSSRSAAFRFIIIGLHFFVYEISMVMGLGQV